MNRTAPFLSVLLLMLPLASAFAGESATYSIGSFHLGLAGETGETSALESRFTLDHNQGSEPNAESASYAANVGWLEPPSAPPAQVVSGGGGNSGRAYGARRIIRRTTPPRKEMTALLQEPQDLQQMPENPQQEPAQMPPVNDAISLKEPIAKHISPAPFTLLAYALLLLAITLIGLIGHSEHMLGRGKEGLASDGTLEQRLPAMQEFHHAIAQLERDGYRVKLHSHATNTHPNHKAPKLPPAVLADIARIEAYGFTVRCYYRTEEDMLNDTVIPVAKDIYTTSIRKGIFN